MNGLRCSSSGSWSFSSCFFGLPVGSIPIAHVRMCVRVCVQRRVSLRIVVVSVVGDQLSAVEALGYLSVPVVSLVFERCALLFAREVAFFDC